MKVAGWSGLEHRGHVQKIGGEGVTFLVPTVNVQVTKTNIMKKVPMIVITNPGSFDLVLVYFTAARGVICINFNLQQR